MAGIKFFVELADQADAKLKEIDEKELSEIEFYREQLQNHIQGRAPAGEKLATAAKLTVLNLTYASQVALSFATEGMVIDVLRIGEGWDKGNWGKAQDILRGLALAGSVIKAGGTAVRVAKPALGELWGFVKAVDFDSRLANCSWCAAANAIRLSGQRIFITVKDIAAAKKLGTMATDTEQILRLTYYIEIFQTLKIEFKAIRMWEAMNGYTTWYEVEKAAKAANGQLLMVGMVWEQGAHAIVVRWVKGSLQFIDRTGKKYRKLAEMPYSGIANAAPSVDAILVPNATVVDTAGTVAAITPNFLNVIAVRVLPTVIKPQSQGNP